MRLIVSLLLSFNFSHAQTDCKKRDNKEDCVPKNLNDAISYLDCKWSDKDKEDFKNTPEDFWTYVDIKNQFYEEYEILSGYVLFINNQNFVIMPSVTAQDNR